MINPYVLLVCAFLAYAMAVDDNVAPFFLLQFKRLGLASRRAIWLITNDPRLPWVDWGANRRAWRLAKEMEKSFNPPTRDGRK